MFPTGVDLATVTSLTPTVAAVVAAVAALASLPFTARAAKAAKIQAETARQQAQLQMDLLRQASQPTVWADIRPDNRQGGLVVLMLKNEGPTVAKNITVTIDPPLPNTFGPISASIRDTEAVLASGLSSVAPGRSLEWSFAVAWQLLAEGPTSRSERSL